MKKSTYFVLIILIGILALTGCSSTGVEDFSDDGTLYN